MLWSFVSSLIFLGCRCSFKLNFLLTWLRSYGSFDRSFGLFLFFLRLVISLFFRCESLCWLFLLFLPNFLFFLLGLWGFFSLFLLIFLRFLRLFRLLFFLFLLNLFRFIGLFLDIFWFRTLSLLPFNRLYFTLQVCFRSFFGFLWCRYSFQRLWVLYFFLFWLFWFCG